MDSIGFTVRYGKELIKIGGPRTNDGIKLIGKDSIGDIETEIAIYEDEKGNIGYRILKLEDQTKPHLANLSDDYSFIQKFAINQKQIDEMDKWVTKTAKNTYINIDKMYKGCPSISKWNIKF